MKHILITSITFFVFLSSFGQRTERTMEAEIDTVFNYQFESLKNKHHKKILIDGAHNTIYSDPVGKITSREMFRIIETDGFNVQFTKKALDFDPFKFNESRLVDYSWYAK